MTDQERPDGVLVVDKPAGYTSHDIVDRVRAILKTKVGHTGTLDPMATGILPLVLGRATRLSRFFQSSDKEYLAEIRLGRTTDSFDREGEIVDEQPVPEISADDAARLLARFTGEIRQQTPVFSAVKVGGKKLYEMARRGKKPELPWRTVCIHHLELLNQSRESWSLRIHCSSGTYIRSLAQEIGQALSCGGYLENLRRLRSGDFGLDRAISVGELEKGWRKVFYPMEEILTELPRIDLSEEYAVRVYHGNEVPGKGQSSGQFCRLFHNDRLVAIGRNLSSRIRPVIVLRTRENEH